MQILESTETIEYSDGSKNIREIKGIIPSEGTKDFSPIGRKHVDMKPGIELRDFTSSQFQEFCEYHNHKLSPEYVEITDKIFASYPYKDNELHMLIVLLFGYDYMAQGIDDHDFHFSSPCSIQEVLSTLQDTYISCQKLLRKFDNGLPQG